MIVRDTKTGHMFAARVNYGTCAVDPLTKEGAPSIEAEVYLPAGWPEDPDQLLRLEGITGGTVERFDFRRAAIVKTRQKVAIRPEYLHDR